MSCRSRLCMFLVHAFLLFVMSASVFADQPNRVIASCDEQQQVIYGPNYHGLNYFPDEPVCLLSKVPFRCFIVSGNATVLMQGQTPEAAKPLRSVLVPGGTNDFDNGYAGITSVYSAGKAKALCGFYHAEDHVGMPKVSYNSDVHGAYWSIGLAVSRDNGNTFTKVGQIIRSSVSKQNVTKEHQGVGDVCVIPEASNTWLYAYYTDLSRRKEDQRATIAMARCRTTQAARRDSWFKYFNGDFKQRGLGGNESAVVTPPEDFPSEVFAPHVTYLPIWKKYIMVCNVLAFADFDRRVAEKSGIYFCHSEDGINWSKLEPLVVGLPIPLQDKEYIAHPSLFVENATDTKSSGYLLYCYSPRWGRPEDNRVPHHLARRAITFTLNR